MGTRGICSVSEARSLRGLNGVIQLHPGPFQWGYASCSMMCDLERCSKGLGTLPPRGPPVFLLFPQETFF